LESLDQLPALDDPARQAQALDGLNQQEQMQPELLVDAMQEAAMGPGEPSIELTAQDDVAVQPNGTQDND
jgi:hypothetical protein